MTFREEIGRQIFVSIQEDSEISTAPGPHVPLPSVSLAAHLAPHLPRRTPPPPLLAAELTSLHLVDLPRASARQRPQLLAFAIEDGLGAPIDRVIVVELPRAGANGATLALAIDRMLVAALDAAHLPEVLALPRPAEAADWHVWRDGDRVLVRAGDGTGFAVAFAALPLLWHRAGRPALVALHGDLGALPHVTAPPPRPVPAELAFRLYPPAADPARHAWRPLRVAAGVAFGALAVHLGIAAADVVALGQRADAARAEAQAALGEVLPGVTVTADTGPVLARLAPQAAVVSGSDAVPMLAEVSAALLTTGTGITMRRAIWGDGRLQTLILAPRLEDLQTAEEALRAAGFTVRAGAASAGQGGAEAEMTIQRAAS